MADLFRSIIGLISVFAIPLMIAVFLGWGFVKKVRVYEVFVEGAKDGFNTAIRIIPYLVAMLFAIGIFRASPPISQMLLVCTAWITAPAPRNSSALKKACVNRWNILAV